MVQSSKMVPEEGSKAEIPFVSNSCKLLQRSSSTFQSGWLDAKLLHITDHKLCPGGK